MKKKMKVSAQERAKKECTDKTRIVVKVVSISPQNCYGKVQLLG